MQGILTSISYLTGKTLLAKTLARFVNVPFVIADATTLTQVTTAKNSNKSLANGMFVLSGFEVKVEFEILLFSAEFRLICGNQ